MAESSPAPSPQCSSPPLISVRIVHIDHYTHSLHAYSSSTPFQAARLSHSSPHAPSKLPVIRIFGTTPAAQQCCLHIHSLRPYLHIPVPHHLSPQALFQYATSLRAALETALTAAFNPAIADAPKALSPALISDVEPVLARSIYGFNSSPSPFLKVSTFSPATVPRIAMLLTHRALPEPFQNLSLPHSSHIPFPLQFLTDHALAGMDYIHLSSCKFRTPLPPPTSSHSPKSLSTLLQTPPHRRLFTSQLQNNSEANLFWPFHVAKRSTSPVEIDAFASDVLNNRATSVDGTYSFVSRTLAVLWEEERLRTGVLPPRIPDGPRLVTAGAHLSPPDVCDRLHQLLDEATKPPHPEPPSQEQNDASSAQPSQATDKDNSQIDDVLFYLDSSAQMDETPSAKGPIMSLAAVEKQTQKMEHPFNQDGEHYEEEFLDDPDDHDSIAQTWEDIAACSQENSRAHDQHPKVANVDVQNTPSSSVIQADHRTPMASTLRAETAGTAATPGTVTPSMSQQATLYYCPSRKPPTASSLASLGSLPPIEWPTPFYSVPSDFVRGHAFGGEQIPIRRSGAEGHLAFEDTFEVSKLPVHLVSQYVSPTRKPPLFSELLLASKASIALGSSLGATSSKQKAIVAIDSMGRLVQMKNNSRKAAHELSLTPDIMSTQTNLVNDIKIGALLCNEDSTDQNSASSDELSGNVKMPQTFADIHVEESSRPPSRPLSPKYDETFHITVPSNRKVREKPQSRTSSQQKDLHNKTSQDGSDSRHFEELNHTVSLSESAHKHQNVSLMSIEILAKSYSDKQPDPTQNELLVICAVVKVDDSASDLKRLECTVLAVKPTLILSSYYRVLAFDTESQLLDGFAAYVQRIDPDVLVGFETQASSIGFILERAQNIGHSFANSASRWLKSGGGGGGFSESNGNAAPNAEAAVAYYHRKGADIKITGRHIISLWRVVRTEVKLTAYSREIVATELFSITFPKHSNRVLETWYNNKRGDHAIRYKMRLAALNVAIVDKLNFLSRNGELARVYGVDFMSVLTRGSQFRVESMMRRVARERGFLLLSAAREEVFRQPAVEALPLVMEPMSGLYVDPVIVLDFQSLYPSVIIAHNLCFSTMLGNVNRLRHWNESRRIGVLPEYVPPFQDLFQDAKEIKNHVFVASNGEMFVDKSVRLGILPQLLEEILETRVMVKKAMKKVVNDEATSNMLNARQFGLKMIANVTYGYTSASFSGRMPCAGLADAIVQCGRDALEEICRFVDDELGEETGASIVYGDTDSLFVRVRGASREEAFKVGERIVKQAEKLFPTPMALKLEKVYQPCVLQTKKRYVGYSYEYPTQAVPIFDAKGIETIRRDTCPLVQKGLERSLRLLFETKDLSVVKRDLYRLCRRLHTDRIPLGDYIFRREVRLGSYKEGHLPPAAIVATKAIEQDSRATPRHGERVSFVVVYDRPGAPLKECVMSPEQYVRLSESNGVRLNTTYYITKQLLPALDRVFSLVGARVATWYADFPKPMILTRSAGSWRRKGRGGGRQSVLPMFYAVSACAICRKRSRRVVCEECTRYDINLQAARLVVESRRRYAEVEGGRLMEACRECTGHEREGGRTCENVSCRVFGEVRETRQRLRDLDEVLKDDVWNRVVG